MWTITNIKGEEEVYYTQNELDLVCIQCKKELENCRLKKDYEELLKTANNGGALLIAEKNKKNNYRQALEEIKHIAEVSDSAPCLKYDCNCEHCKDECTNNGKHCMEYGLKKIQKKIDEVLNEK